MTLAHRRVCWSLVLCRKCDNSGKLLLLSGGSKTLQSSLEAAFVRYMVSIKHTI